MDNRDEEEKRTEAITPTDNRENTDWDDADPSDMSKVSTAPQDDLSEANEMDLEESLPTDSETSDERATPGVNDSTSAPEKDFLVDSGLAAAISPKHAESELTTEDDLDEDAEESESAWTDSESALAYQDDDIDDEDREDDDLEYDDEDDLEDDEDLDEDDLEEDDDENDADGTDEHNSGFDNGLTDRAVDSPDARATRSAWPMLVGFVAVMLIAVGGWGLFEERAALQTRINELERSQSQAQSTTSVDTSVLSALETDNAALKLQLDGLYRDYELAVAEITSLQEAREMTTTDAPEEDERVSAVATKPEVSTPTSDTELTLDTDGVTGDWFVNVGAYSVPQSAENIAAQLADGGVDAVVQEISTDDGKVLFRVRVTGLSTREDARQVGNDLESRYGINPVWVGQSPSSP
jgi:cell division protein FtsN